MADTKHKLKKYKQYLESNPDGDKVLSVLNKLDALPVSISLLQDTGIGKLVNGFRKKPDGIGTVAKSIVNKWKNLVAEEAKKVTKLDSEEDEQEYVPEPPKNVKYEASYNPTSKSQSDDEYCPKHVAEEYTPEQVKIKPPHRKANKYDKYSNEKYKPKNTSSHSSSKEKYVPTKIPSPDNSDNETYDPSRMNDDPLPYSPQHVSDNSEEEAYDQATPEQNDSDEYNPMNSEASPTGASYTPTPKYESEQRHKSSSAKSEKHSSKSAKSSHSDGHTSRNGSSHSSGKNESSHSSSKNSKSEKHSSNGEKHSSKHKSSHDEKHSKSDKHSSKHSDNEKHSSKHSDNEKHSKSQNGTHSSKSKDNVPNGKHPSSSSSHKDKKPSSSSAKASSSSDKTSNDRSSSSKSSEKHSSHSDRKSNKNTVISESPSKTKLDKNRNEKRKIPKIQPIEDSFDLFNPDDGAVVKHVKVESKPKVDASSKSSKDSHKHSKHHSSSSSSKPKEERPDKKDSTSKSTKHADDRLEKRDKHSKSKSSSSSKGEKRKMKVEESVADDATDGFSFDDFLNCDVKAPKKKLKKDPESSGSPWSSSLKVSKPSTSKMASRAADDSRFTVPKPSKQILDINESDILSLLPETSATYRPLPTRSLEDERKHSLATFDPMVIGTKQGKRTIVYSGRKHGLSEMKSLFSQCIQVLMDNIDALDYVGGVPYDILKPVLERCSVHQLLRLEDLNPHFVGDDEELWAVHCEKEFKNQEPDEMESWREFYLRLVEEREVRLEKLRTSMNRQQAAKPKSRQVQLAYVDNYVKPPREVLRKQQRYGTGKVVSASNSIQSTSRGARANFSHNISVPQPKAVKPVAPMMQKINKMLAKRRR